MDTIHGMLRGHYTLGPGPTHFDGAVTSLSICSSIPICSFKVIMILIIALTRISYGGKITSSSEAGKHPRIITGFSKDVPSPRILQAFINRGRSEPPWPDTRIKLLSRCRQNLFILILHLKGHQRILKKSKNRKSDESEPQSPCVLGNHSTAPP